MTPSSHQGQSHADDARSFTPRKPYYRAPFTGTELFLSHAIKPNAVARIYFVRTKVAACIQRPPQSVPTLPIKAWFSLVIPEVVCSASELEDLASYPIDIHRNGQGAFIFQHLLLLGASPPLPRRTERSVCSSLISCLSLRR